MLRTALAYVLDDVHIEVWIPQGLLDLRRLQPQLSTPAPGDVRGLELEPLVQVSSSGQPPSAARELKNGPEEALLAVIAWVQANKGTLQLSGRQEQGQWEATVQGEPVLLIRQAWLNRILLGRKFDLRAVMTTWRDRGVIIAEEKRFTVYTRVNDRDQRGARFVALRWDRLEIAGLSKA